MKDHAPERCNEAKDCQKTISELTEELNKTRERELRLARRKVWVAGITAGFASRVLVGPDLLGSIKAWRKAVKPENPLPTPETEELIAAVFRRALRVGIWAILLAVIPGILLIWQNILISKQVTQQGLQIEQQAADVRQRTEDNLIARRAQLIDILYEQNCHVSYEDRGVVEDSDRSDLPRNCEPPKDSGAVSDQEKILQDLRKMSAAPTPGPGRRSCPPKAHLRARQEAAKALVALERKNGGMADLSYVDLAQASLGNLDLSSVRFSGANLHWAHLGEANLQNASFFGAYMPWAQLYQANLVGAEFAWANLCSANLKGADLRNASFRGASFARTLLSGANFEGSNLSGADLRRTEISLNQLNSARGDSTTLLPPLDQPPSWANLPAP